MRRLRVLLAAAGILAGIAAPKARGADLDKKVKAFGGREEMTERQLMLRILNHMHEHLGQSIAYARSNGVTPPWSEAGETPAKKS